MEPRSRNRSTSFSGPENWRNGNNLNTMSISELFSELRNTFRSSDFDLVEQTLISREKMLKEEIEKMKRELLLSAERMEFEKLERITVEFKLGKIQEEMKKKKLMKNGNEKGNVVTVKNRAVAVGVGVGVGDGDGDGVGVASSDAKMVGENVRILVKEMVEELEKKNNHLKSLGDIDYEIEVKTVVGDDDKVVKAGVEAPAPVHAEPVEVLAKKKRYVGEPGKKRSVTEPKSSSGAKPIAIPPDDAMRKAAITEKIRLLQNKNQFKSLGRLNFDGEGDERCKLELLKNHGEASAGSKLKDQKVELLAEKKTLAGEPSKNDDLGSSGIMQKNSSGAVHKNPATKLVGSIGIKRDFPLDVLDSSDSSSSSSSSSSSAEFDMDIPPSISLSNKKMKTNASQSTNGLFTKLNKGK